MVSLFIFVGYGDVFLFVFFCDFLVIDDLGIIIVVGLFDYIWFLNGD